MTAGRIDLPHTTQILTGFDGTVQSNSTVYRPDRYRDLMRLAEFLPAVGLKGAGLSYALAFAGSDASTIDLKLFDRFLQFDQSRGLLKAEAGMKIGTALSWCTQRGFNIGVLPGHPEITIGGCVAFNVHGKSQFSTGNFEAIVSELTLFHPTHGTVICSREQNSELFWLTIGGMGLTGIILNVTLILTPLKGAQIERTSFSCQSLSDAYSKMAALEDQFDYLYSWNNFCLSGDKFGRGVVYAEKFIGNPEKPIFGELKSKIKPVAARPKISLFRAETASTINCIYGWKERLASKVTVLDIGPATFPIAGKEFYFSLLGKFGFIEYQCIFPHLKLDSALKKLAGIIKKENIKPSLGSTKFFRGANRNLCFQMDGFCVAIDIPLAGHPNLNSALDQIDSLVIEFGGIANIAKDSRISRSTVAAMFPEYSAFWSAIAKWDPSKNFRNSVRSRLEPL